MFVPGHGDELTYSELEFSTQSELDDYLRGEDVTMRCVD
jgi:hypothetical protein